MLLSRDDKLRLLQNRTDMNGDGAAPSTENQRCHRRTVITRPSQPVPPDMRCH